jgi:signal transduction histidine kinase
MSAPLQLSLFQLLRHGLDDELALMRCTKATLVHVSHTLEDIVLRHQLKAVLFTGFQESSHWREETERYRALADIAHQICIFAGGDLPPESHARQLHVTLSGDDPLRQEWFLAILSSTFSVVLCGQDCLAAAEDEASRQFNTLLTFDPQAINQVLDRIELVLAHYRPEKLNELQSYRKATPIQAPDPVLMTIFATELIRFEEQLNHSLRTSSNSLHRQLRWREELAETLVHDLRTPLQGLMQTIDYLRQTSDLDQDAIDDMLALASTSAQQLMHLTQLLLDTNRLEAGQLTLNWLPVSPRQFLDDALKSLESLFDYANLQLNHLIEPELTIIWGDPGLLARLVQNLVGNAVKFTPDGGRVNIELFRSPDTRQIELRVRDTGIGIDPQLLPHIFERYYQVRRERRHGSGIGLYFCRLVAEAHGGSIRADSKPGHGTSITVSLPRRPPQLDATLMGTMHTPR